MSGKPKYGAAQIDAFIEMRERGLSYGQIAMKTGASETTISWHCLKLGAEPPKPRGLRAVPTEMVVEARGDHIVRRFTRDEDAQLLELAAQGLTDTQIGLVLGRRPNSVGGRLMCLARRDERAGA